MHYTDAPVTEVLPQIIGVVAVVVVACKLFGGKGDTEKAVEKATSAASGWAFDGIVKVGAIIGLIAVFVSR